MARSSIAWRAGTSDACAALRWYTSAITRFTDVSLGFFA